jgi:hypothetical protein
MIRWRRPTQRAVTGQLWGWPTGVAADQIAQGGVATVGGVRQVDAAGYWFELP